MIGAVIDRAVAGSSAFEKIFRNRINTIYRTNPLSEGAAFLAASAAGGIFASFGNDIMFIITLTIMIAVWIQTAFTAGFLREWLYAVFLLLYFWLPGIFILPAENLQAHTQYMTEDMLSDISCIIWASPLTRLFPWADITTGMLITAAAEILIFLAGSRMRTMLKNSAVYCKIRLEHLAKPE